MAMAGPAMNFCLAWLAAVAMHPLEGAVGTTQAAVQMLLLRFILFNLVLGLFNLLPIPPLDGGRIIVGILPLKLAALWAQTERAGIVIVLALLFIVPMLARQVGLDFDPVRDGLSAVLPWALRLIFSLAGFDGAIDDDNFDA